MSGARLARLIPVMEAQKNVSMQRMAEILAREAECTTRLDQLSAQEAKQAAASALDPFAGDGLSQWRIWAVAQRRAVNLRLASLRAERELQSRKLAVLVGRLDVTETMVQDANAAAARQRAVRQYDDDF